MTFEDWDNADLTSSTACLVRKLNERLSTLMGETRASAKVQGRRPRRQHSVGRARGAAHPEVALRRARRELEPSSSCESTPSRAGRPDLVQLMVDATNAKA